MALTADDLMDTEQLADLIGVEPGQVRSARHRLTSGKGGHILEGLPGPLRFIGRNPVYDAKVMRKAVEAKRKAEAKAARAKRA